MSNDPDPRPQAPEKPLPCDCCETGCEPCVYTVYTEELEEYEARLAAWKARHPEDGEAG